jgi:enoyl-[acyl-carrier-protein] reductase (NADH)
MTSSNAWDVIVLGSGIARLAWALAAHELGLRPIVLESRVPEQLALQNAPYGIRANCILPGLMDTPMAVDTRARASNRSRAEVAAERDAKVPLRGRMGTAWDVANAALFLASDEANFITGVALPVDGGALVRFG